MIHKLFIQNCNNMYAVFCSDVTLIAIYLAQIFNLKKNISTYIYIFGKFTNIIFGIIPTVRNIK